MSYLEMKHITKRFPGVLALDDVSFSLEKGEVHALLGENGAGKSTLMNVLYGLYQANSGEISLNGQTVQISEPKDALKHGVGMVHQHFMLIPAMTAAENIILGTEKGVRSLPMEQLCRQIMELSQRYGLGIDPSAKVAHMTVGQCQRLEILKALYRKAEILIFDEPTAVLTPQEVTEFYGIVRSLKAENHSVVFITHKLAEVMELCDRVTVLRQGRKMRTLEIGEVTGHQMLAELMVGKSVELSIQKEERTPGGVVLEVEGLCAKDAKGIEKLKDVSLQIREGEIVGIAGVDGNGQHELVECLAGLHRMDRGTMRIGGRDCTNAPVREILDQGVSHIAEDRHKRAMVGEMSIKENMLLMNYATPRFCRHGLINWKEAAGYADELCREYEVKTPDCEESSRKLSGGNQQKMVLGRELSRKPKLLYAVHPVRGLDIGATQFIHRRLLEERQRGAAILLVSTELDEILELSDRILVIFDGQIVGEVSGKDAKKEEIGILMAGGKKHA